MSSSDKPKVLFYVQHLLGVGHVFRAVRVAKAIARQGCEVHLVWGGTLVPGMNTDGLQIAHLEAVHIADGDFSNLLLTNGSPISEAGKAGRRDTLLELFGRVQPDIVITEAYPFGRRQMRFELLPLLVAVRAAPWRPMLVSSIRDIMQENRAEKRVQEYVDIVKQHFDLIMVHGDPKLIPIEASLQGAAAFADKIVYTGLVTPEPVDMTTPPSVNTDVLISAGGGAVSVDLLTLSIQAMELRRDRTQTWCVITGPDLPGPQFEQLKNNAPEGLNVIRFVSDLARVMAAARVSVSRAGYNTVGDILRAQTRAILIPFAEGEETEQLRRAKIMEERGVATLLEENDLSAEILAETIEAVISKPKTNVTLDLDGADNAAKILIDAYRKRASGIAGS